ncbi:hypothetical protein [Aphanothece sacrum]|uniref:Lambda family phage tail tape measure protein n=1 Tax=Aphanothece sacrum FPU1 TaxID=1920663 RepID=A0A401III9_APHSA|nr:hypothetical protein [Aphanothece sacrum]GBF81098.1 lambda family phage tail tape measure protein [Aphanothece sacrum FPU1]GBF85499.1 lambda family phage tail tape measure protein [Aphanothece sacrum FPU3]
MTIMIKNQTLITILCSLILTSFSGVYTSQINPAIAAETEVNNPLDNTEWELVSWDESQPLGEKRPTISFTNYQKLC